jgi:integrating conjugative element protein (TIGR03758 family)
VNARTQLLAVLLGMASAAACAQCSHTDFLYDLGMRESRLDPSARNPFGYIGLFQMGEAALQDAGYYRGDLTRANDWTGSWTGAGGINSLGEFYARPDSQVQAIVAYHNGLVGQIRSLGLDRSVGSTVGGVPVTLSGLVAGAHLVGIGNLQTFINSSGSTVPRDGNGVPITTYIAELGGCAVGSSAPSFAAVVAATGGAGVGPAPVVPPTTGVPIAPSPIAVDPSTAFAMASGRQPMEVRDAIAAIIATLLTLWLAWTSQATFSAWCRRRTSLFAMKTDIIRGCIVLCIVLVILQ